MVKFKLFRDQSEKRVPKDTTAPFWKHCSLSPSFRAEEAGLTRKFSRSWPGEDSADHGHYAYDAIPEATISRLHDARHFWRPGHKTLAGGREKIETKRGKNKGKERTEREGTDTQTNEQEDIQRERERPRKTGDWTERGEREEKKNGR
ncbi:hypothetical protein NC652_001200 [Populus alba x Populus x berolinensis]|nr:hypothetical protein NC652_001200 [Populus alba x Populus x berolinensis]